MSTQANALTEIPESNNAPDTVRVATVPGTLAWTDAAGVDTNGGCGRPNSYCGNVTITSFYANAELHNVYAEITEMTPATGHLGFSNTIPPPSGEVTATYGLWAYPTLQDSTRGATTGGNAATRTWRFDLFTWEYFHPTLFTVRQIVGRAGVIAAT